MEILIGDDHAIFRRGLREILTEAIPDVVCAEAENGAEVLEQVWKKKWDLVVLDITMPGRSGLDVLKDINSAHPELPVLVLSTHTEEQYAVRVLRAGAKGFINKMKAPRELVSAIQKVLQGGSYISPTVAEKLATQIRPGGELLHHSLSDREYQVMHMIATGKSVKEVASEMGLSVQTVSTYRVRVLKKLGMQTNAELIRYAIQNGLVD